MKLDDATLESWANELEEWREEKNTSNTFGRDACNTEYYIKMSSLISALRERDELLARQVRAVGALAMAHALASLRDKEQE